MNALKTKKWSLSAPSGGSVEYISHIYREKYLRDIYTITHLNHIRKNCKCQL